MSQMPLAGLTPDYADNRFEPVQLLDYIVNITASSGAIYNPNGTLLSGKVKSYPMQKECFMPNITKLFMEQFIVKILQHTCGCG